MRHKARTSGPSSRTGDKKAIKYRPNIEKFLSDSPVEKNWEMLDTEFGMLMTAERRELIKRCLRLRRQQLCQALEAFKGDAS